MASEFPPRPMAETVPYTAVGPVAVTESMARFLQAHPVKYSFFGGKGGVGKTAMAGALALSFAESGKRTMLCSTNPVHSLSSLLGQNVFGKATPVNGAQNLWAYEIDTK